MISIEQCVSNINNDCVFLGNIDPDMNDLSSENDASSHDSQSDYSSDESEATHDQIEIERQTFLQQLIEFIRDANLNKTTTSSLLSLLNSSKSYDEIPVSINQLLKQLDVKFYYDSFVYCSTCLTSLSKIQDRCINCGTSKIKANSELIIFSVADELRRVVQSNIELIKWYSFRENQMISDIVLGDIYKERCSNNSTLTLMITTDGKPMIKSKATRTSVWPVMSFVVEIPPFIRERLDNMMLLGLWHSPISPPADLLLSRIVDLIKSLTMTGIDILVGKKFQHFDVHVQLMSGDLPARAKCNKLNGHNGFFACSRCLLEGRRCASPCKRHTLYRWSDYLPYRHISRTQEHINQYAQQVSGNIRTSYGVLGPSPISSILSIPLQSTLDYFHLALEVHLRTLMCKWSQMIKDYPGAIAFIDDFLNSISYPHSFNRTPKGFLNYGKWKASELRTFLVYVSLPALVRLRLAMPKCFPEVYVYHFSLYFIYIRNLRHFSNRDEIREMPTFIEEYLKLFSSLYDQCAELYSAHALYHLHEQVEEHGGLAHHSLFSTESCLNHIAKLSHGSISLGQQISYWWCIHRQINSRKMINRPTLFTKSELILDSFFVYDVIENYRQEFDLAYNQTFGEFPPQSMKFYSRYVHGLINPTPIQVPSDVPKVMYNGRNLLAGPIEPTPGGLMKQLINDLFTEDEIILGYHEQVNEKTDKIKEAVKNYFFRDDDENFRVFWGFDGHITRGNQRRGRAYRKKKNDLEQQKSVQLNTTASDINDGDQNKN
ncbi:unnamed protein product [Rotaria sp. Silwood1]|nr:unnamed protein product [Rotaria sp. Silwood1]